MRPNETSQLKGLHLKLIYLKIYTFLNLQICPSLASYHSCSEGWLDQKLSIWRGIPKKLLSVEHVAREGQIRDTSIYYQCFTANSISLVYQYIISASLQIVKIQVLQCISRYIMIFAWNYQLHSFVENVKYKGLRSFVAKNQKFGFAHFLRKDITRNSCYEESYRFSLH